ncbi:MAG: YitT family protein [Clostridia bacterium]|nr:YitT family protein [Clostridia bacterium]
MLTIAGILYAIGVTMFLTPVHLYDSGISGTSMLLSQITPHFLRLTVFLIVLNVPLFLYGLRKQGVLFTVYSLYGVAIYAAGAFVIEEILPIDVRTASPLAQTDLLLCALFGGLICGLGTGLALRFGGAMDGIEVIAVIFAPRFGLSVGTLMMMYNAVLFVVCGAVTGNWIPALYSIVAYAAALKTVDYVVEGFDRSKAAMIVTTKPEEVCAALSAEYESGMTRITATGGYSYAEKTVIYFVVNRFQIARMRDIVHALDPNAYITISDVADVYPANQRKE